MAVTDLTGTSWHLADSYTSYGISFGGKEAVNNRSDAPNNSDFNSTNGYWLKCKYEGEVYEGYVIPFYDYDGVGHGGLWIGGGTSPATQLIKSNTYYDPTYEQRTLRIVGGTDATNTTLINSLTSSADWRQINIVSVDLATAFPEKWAGLTIGKHTLQIRAKNPGNYLDSDLSTTIDFYKTVPITVTATNCTAAANNPTEFPDVGGGDTILTFNKKTGYTLPETIVITGVAGQNIGYSWTVASDGQSAQLKILKALGDIEVTVTGVAETYSITTNLTHATKESGPSTIAYDASATLKFSFPTGYEAPDKTAITVTGAEDFTWEKGTGTMVLLKAQGPVTVTLVGVETNTTIDGGTYKWRDNASLTEWTQEINFTSNGASYSGMRYTGNGTAMTLQYMNADSEWQTAYNYDEDASTGSWVNDAYKIVDLGTSAQTVTAIFKADFITNTTKLTQLSTPQNVTAEGTVVSWDEVENATSYEVIEGGNNVLGTVENPVPSGYAVTLTSWDEQVGSDDGAAVKFNTPPTSENDYDYRTGKLYDDTGLYNASGAKVTQPIIIDGVSKVYVFRYAQYGSSSAGGYKLNGGSVEYGGEWNNPAVISLTENSTLSLLHAQD